MKRDTRDSAGPRRRLGLAARAGLNAGAANNNSNNLNPA